MTAIGQRDIWDRTNGDFDRARRKALMRRALARLTGAPDRLLSLDESGVLSDKHRPAYVGMKDVEIRSIIGSVGRHRDFDRTFLPMSRVLGERWKRVDRAFRLSERLPPVRLSKVGDAYFVLDGNHRVSVARFHGAEWITAEVTELHGAPGAGTTSDGRRRVACR